MDFKHPQPFTWSQVSELDVSTLADEITRLQNSLRHLKNTQNELQLLVDTISMTPDAAEFMSAIQDNRDVIDSQEERITILKTALARKGVDFNSHYDLDDLQPQHPTTTELVVDTGAVDSINDDDHDGIHL